MSDEVDYAFPLPVTSGNPGHPGMSLRDWFAGQALAGLMANPNMIEVGYDSRDVAALTFNLADAMLAEREKRSEGD